MAADVSELAYETGIAAIDKQEAELAEVRQRTGILLAAGSLIASLLGAEVIGRTDGGFWHDVAVLAAIAAFLAFMTACIYLLAPKSNLRFAPSGSGLYEALGHHGANMPPVHQQMVRWLQSQWNTNQAKLDRMNQIFALACGLLLAQMVLWALALLGRVDIVL